MTNAVLNWLLKPAPYALISLLTSFCSWWCLEMTDKKLDSVHRHWEFSQWEENQKNRHTQPISQFHRALQRYLDTSTEQIKDQQHFSVHQDCAAEIKIDASQLTKATKSCTIVGSHPGPLRLAVISEFKFFSLWI